MTSGSDRKRCLDLVDLVQRLTYGEYRFIELKIESNTFIDAVYEFLLYAVLYVFSRLHYNKSECEAKELLQARSIHLQTLAPQSYYHKYQNLALIAESVNEGLQHLRKVRRLSSEMDFSPGVFPEGFDCPRNISNCDPEKLRKAVDEVIAI